VNEDALDNIAYKMGDKPVLSSRSVSAAT
jgi:hypothetical protein